MPATASSTVSETDVTSRGGLSLLLVSALAWLVLGTLLAFIAGIQLHSPLFLSDLPALTHGRVVAMAETALVYGWGGNAAVAVALWLLSRFGGAPLRGPGLLVGGTLFWNIGLGVGIFALGAGEGTSIAYLQLPAYLHPLLLVSFGAMATPGVLAWTGRRRDDTYASQWYALAALFLFPWLYSAAQVMLLDRPVRGVAQAVVAAWYGQNVLGLWLVPVALAAAYYLVPKLNGRPLPHYGLATLGFWVLVVLGSWSGGRHLVGSPAPVWVSSVGIVAACLMIFHYLVIAINFPAGLFGGGRDTALRFVRLGLWAYVIGGVCDTIFSFHAFAPQLQFTYFPQAQTALLLTGAITFLLFGAFYEMAPRVTGVAWPSAGLTRMHYLTLSAGTGLTVAGLAVAGWVQGNAQLDPENTYAAVAAAARPWLLVATGGQAILFLAALVVFVNFVRLQLVAGFDCSRNTSATAPVSAS